MLVRRQRVRAREGLSIGTDDVRDLKGRPFESAHARRDPLALREIYKDLRLGGVDVLVLSSCVQMPSLAAVPIVEQECGLPVISASIATTYQMLKRLGLKAVAPDAGALLSGRYS